MSDLAGKIILVTGASRGFGYAAALELAARGAEIIALARTTGGLEELDDAITKFGGKATLVPLDITDDAGLQRMCHAINDRWGGLDYWVHSAIHATPLAPAGHVSENDLDKSIAVNVRAAQRLITMVDPLLRAKSGTAIYLDDARAGEKFFAAYGASKAAQKALFDSWAVEGVSTGPKVRSFTPDAMPTALRARFFPGEDRAKLTPEAVVAKKFADWLIA
ncbi:MAG: oxidoreductase [Rhodobacteraceae bacterium]|nr:MAG: oxidoreductase [Paracoccaceae bacterium]